jgi:hypothetical protein
MLFTNLLETGDCKEVVGCVRFEAFTEVTMKKGVFWDVTLCRTLQPATHTCSPLADYSTLKMEAISSSETSVYPTSTKHHIPEDNILQVVCCSLTWWRQVIEKEVVCCSLTYWGLITAKSSYAFVRNVVVST